MTQNELENLDILNYRLAVYNVDFSKLIDVIGIGKFSYVDKGIADLNNESYILSQLKNVYPLTAVNVRIEIRIDVKSEWKPYEDHTKLFILAW